MKISGIGKEGHKAKNVESNPQIKTAPMINNQLLSKIILEYPTTKS